MKVGIIDADLIYRTRHRFPNLACMKISGFYKREGHHTELVQDYKQIRQYDRLYLSKVFTDTYVPDEILQLGNLVYGGTGFYYDKAPPLPEEIEHGMPDYGLYEDYAAEKIQTGKSRAHYKYYTDVLLCGWDGLCDHLQPVFLVPLQPGSGWQHDRFFDVF